MRINKTTLVTPFRRVRSCLLTDPKQRLAVHDDTCLMLSCKRGAVRKKRNMILHEFTIRGWCFYYRIVSTSYVCDCSCKPKTIETNAENGCSCARASVARIAEL